MANRATLSFPSEYLYCAQRYIYCRHLGEPFVAQSHECLFHVTSPRKPHKSYNRIKVHLTRQQSDNFSTDQNTVSNSPFSRGRRLRTATTKRQQQRKEEAKIEMKMVHGLPRSCVGCFRLCAETCSLSQPRLSVTYFSKWDFQISPHRIKLSTCVAYASTSKTKFV